MKKISGTPLSIKITIFFTILNFLSLLFCLYYIIIAVRETKTQFEKELTTINLTLEQIDNELNKLKTRKSKTVITNVKLTIVGNQDEKKNHRNSD